MRGGRGQMLNDMDVLRQMYATLCGSIDDALTLLEWGNVWEAKKNLQRGLEIAEDIYVRGDQAEEELAALRGG